MTSLLLLLNLAPITIGLMYKGELALLLVVSGTLDLLFDGLALLRFRYAYYALRARLWLPVALLQLLVCAVLHVTLLLSSEPPAAAPLHAFAILSATLVYAHLLVFSALAAWQLNEQWCF
jgi:hypothetical protein